MLLVLSMFMMAGVCDSGTDIDRIPSPALIPTSAWVPPTP